MPQEQTIEYNSGTMYQSDAIEALRTLPDRSVDLILTDPPYSSLEKWRAIGTTTRLKVSDASSNEWFPVVENSYFVDFFKECYRILRNNSHIYVFCDFETALAIDPMVTGAGFTRKKPVIWNKVGTLVEECCPNCKRPVGARRKPGSPGMGYPYRSCYELIYFGSKGDRPVTGSRNVRDVLECERIKGDGAYPTEKPIELLQVLLGQSSVPDSLIVDPFAGSGSTILAATGLGRRAFGFDIQQATVDRFNNRPIDVINLSA